MDGKIEYLKKYEVLLLCLLLLFSFLIRIYEPNLIRFDVDQTAHFMPIYQLIHEGKIPLTGQTMLGTINYGPFTHYLFLIPFFFSFSENPFASLIFLIGIYILTILILFKLCKKMFNLRVAIISASFFSFSTYMIYTSRDIFHYSLVPFFSVIFAYACYKFFIIKKKKYVALIIVSYAILLQIHAIPYSFIFILIAMYFYTKPKFNLKYVIIGLTLALLLFSPLIYHETQTGFSDYKEIFQTKKIPITEKGSFLEIFLQSISINNHLYGFTRKYLPVFLASFFFKLMNMIEHIIIFVSILFCFYYFFKLKNDKIKYQTKASILFLLLWFFVPFLFLYIVSYNIKIGYFIALYPQYFVFVGIFIDWILSKFKNKIVYWITLIIIILIILSNILIIFKFYSLMDKEGYIKEGIVLRNQKEIVSASINELRINNCEINYNFHSYGINEILGFDYLFKWLAPSNNEFYQNKCNYAYLLIPKTKKEIIQNMEFVKKHEFSNYFLIKYIPSINQDAITIEDMKTNTIEKLNKKYNPFNFNSNTLKIQGKLNIPKETKKLNLILKTRSCIANLSFNNEIIFVNKCSKEKIIKEVIPSENIFQIENSMPNSNFSFYIINNRAWDTIELFGLRYN